MVLLKHFLLLFPLQFEQNIYVNAIETHNFLIMYVCILFFVVMYFGKFTNTNSSKLFPQCQVPSLVCPSHSHPVSHWSLCKGYIVTSEQVPFSPFPLIVPCTCSITGCHHLLPVSPHLSLLRTCSICYHNGGGGGGKKKKNWTKGPQGEKKPQHCLLLGHRQRLRLRT